MDRRRSGLVGSLRTRGTIGSGSLMRMSGALTGRSTSRNSVLARCGRLPIRNFLGQVASHHHGRNRSAKWPGGPVGWSPSMGAFQSRRLRGVSVPGALAALVAAAADLYILLVIGQGVGHHLGRIFIFIPGFVAILAIASAAGAMTRGLTQRAALLGMAAAGLGTLGVLWIWINLFTLETAGLHLIAAALATIAMAAAVVRSHPRPS